MIRYYDKDGTPITDVIAWGKKLQDPNYQCVAQTHLPNGKLVSTVWLGLDHQYGDGPPLIFETMVFPHDSTRDLDCERYSTKAEALAGHERMVGKWSLISGDNDETDS